MSDHLSPCLSFHLSVPAAIEYKPAEYAEHDYSEPPKFTTPLADHSATVGYSTKLLCSVRGSPAVGPQPPLPSRTSTTPHYLLHPHNPHYLHIFYNLHSLHTFHYTPRPPQPPLPQLTSNTSTTSTISKPQMPP